MQGEDLLKAKLQKAEAECERLREENARLAGIEENRHHYLRVKPLCLSISARRISSARRAKAKVHPH